MNVTPEMVRAQMQYRVERALAGSELEHVREARRQRPAWYRRLVRHREPPSRSVVNGRPRAA